MFLEVMIHNFKKGQFAKSIIGQINIWKTQRVRNREKEKDFNIKQAALAC